MTMDVRDVGGVVVVGPSGAVDRDRSPELRTLLLGLARERRPVVVDLGGVDSIDSSGVAGLVEACYTARTQGGRFTLANVSPAAMRVLHLTRLDKVFAIAASVESAVGTVP